MPPIDPRDGPPPAAWGVEIDPAAVERLADRWAEHRFAPPTWDYPGLPRYPWPAAWLDFCGIGCTVIACLWPPEGDEPWSVERPGDPEGGASERLTDAPALFHCFERGLAASPDGLDLEPLAAWSDAACREFFRGRGRLQLLAERRRALSAAVAALRGRWGGRFLHLVEDAGWHGPAIVERLVATLPGYRDEATTAAGRVAFHKRAHLAAAMMGGRPETAVSGTEGFPVYADYMLPRVLRHFEVLRYAPGLAVAVDHRRPIAAGSPREVAIRWATVHAAELLRGALARRGNPVAAPHLDYHLWHAAVLGPDAAAMGEHHRTLTLAY